MYKLEEPDRPVHRHPRAGRRAPTGRSWRYMMRQYTDGERERHKLRGVVTGKDVRIGGSEGRVKATGQGVVYCIEDWARERRVRPQGRARARPGLRQRRLRRGGDPRRAGRARSARRERRERHDLQRATASTCRRSLAHVHANPTNLRRTVAGFPGAQAISKNDFWEVDADILVPAALGERDHRRRGRAPQGEARRRGRERPHHAGGATASSQARGSTSSRTSSATPAA